MHFISDSFANIFFLANETQCRNCEVTSSGNATQLKVTLSLFKNNAAGSWPCVSIWWLGNNNRFQIDWLIRAEWVFKEKVLLQDPLQNIWANQQNTDSFKSLNKSLMYTADFDLEYRIKSTLNIFSPVNSLMKYKLLFFFVSPHCYLCCHWKSFRW